jgi:Tfp pilus assembly protein PilO
MANTEPQLALADIQEPVLNTFWPPAPGWWLLALLLIVVLAYGFRFFWKKWQKALPLRQAKAELRLIKEPHQSTELNELLKRLVSCYCPRHAVLSAPVKQWQDFLQQQLPQQPLPDLQKLLYQQQSEQTDFSVYLQFAAKWLNKVSAKQLEQL